MKAILLVMMTIFMNSAFATIPTMEFLPPVKDPKIEIKAAANTLNTHPTSFLSFQFSSCRVFKFTVTQEENLLPAENGTIFLKVKPRQDQAECRGPKVKRIYKLMLTKQYDSQRYIILNPLQLSYL